VFVVKDNGAGFDMQLRDKLSGVSSVSIRRPSSRAPVSGSPPCAASLPGTARICRSAVDQGATFYFTL